MIQFVESCHIYHDNGRPVPSVTQIIKAVCGSSYDNISPRTLEIAAFRGTCLHRATELVDRGECTETYVQDVRNASKEAFGDEIDITVPIDVYKGLNRPKWAHIEKVGICNGEFPFCYTIDRIDENGNPWELKFTAESKMSEWLRQLSFYAIAENTDTIGGVIHITKDGKMPKSKTKIGTCFEDAKAILRVFYLVHYKTWLEEAKKLLAESFHGEMI